jgi:glycosyltransferase involved in cell wall biosynthesis
VKALREEGVEAEIATTNDNGAGLLNVPLGVKTQYQDVPIWFFSRFSPGLCSLQDFKFSYPLTRWLWQHIEEYDLVHVHAIFSYPSTVAMAIARHKRVSYIVRPLGQLCQWCLEQSASKKHVYLTLVERANLLHSQAVHFTSAQEHQETCQAGFQHPHWVLPHGVSAPTPRPAARHMLRQRLQVPENELVILFMARLHPKKGLDYLIPALKDLAMRHRFTLVLAGSGSPEYEAEVHQLIETAGLHGRTHCPGFVEAEEKEVLLQGSDLFVLTSYSENFGIAVLEAMAAGLPVIVTPGVALSAVVQEHQVGFVTPLDQPAIAATIETCLSNPQVLQERGNRARLLVERHYSWRENALNLIKRYQTIDKKSHSQLVY